MSVSTVIFLLKNTLVADVRLRSGHASAVHS